MDQQKQPNCPDCAEGAGFNLDRILPVDQFLWSPHIELVGVFLR